MTEHLIFHLDYIMLTDFELGLFGLSIRARTLDFSGFVWVSRVGNVTKQNTFWKKIEGKMYLRTRSISMVCSEFLGLALISTVWSWFLWILRDL